MNLRHTSAFMIIFAFLTACGFQGPYVGKAVNNYHPLICHCGSLPTHCQNSDEFFYFEYTISKGEGENEYIIDGFVDGRGKEGEQWDEINSGNFFILLANQSLTPGYKTIIQHENILPRAKDLTQRIPFKKTFTCEENFDSAIFSYNLRVIYR